MAAAGGGVIGLAVLAIAHGLRDMYKKRKEGRIGDKNAMSKILDLFGA
jgi:hypothetical protein